MLILYDVWTGWMFSEAKRYMKFDSDFLVGKFQNYRLFFFLPLPRFKSYLWISKSLVFFQNWLKTKIIICSKTNLTSVIVVISFLWTHTGTWHLSSLDSFRWFEQFCKGVIDWVIWCNLGYICLGLFLGHLVTCNWCVLFAAQTFLSIWLAYVTHFFAFTFFPFLIFLFLQ